MKEKKIVKLCNQDCFNCIYLDCKLPAYILTQKDYAQTSRIDKDIKSLSNNKPTKYIFPSQGRIILPDNVRLPL